MPVASKLPLPEPGERREAAATKERLLAAAGELFAERGFDGTSMRAITRAADVSVSAVNYHFGSKLGLLQATLQRGIAPANERRLEQLGQLERGSAPPTVEAIVEAFLRPTVELRAESAEIRAGFRRVASRIFSERQDIARELRQELLDPVVERFEGALARALPESPREEIHLAFHFTIGVVAYVVGGHLDAAMHAEGSLPFEDEEVLERMIAYVVAGIRAAVARPSAEGEPA